MHPHPAEGGVWAWHGTGPSPSSFLGSSVNIVDFEINLNKLEQL